VGRPESWPGGYQIPLQTEVHDEGIGFGVVNGIVVAFTKDTLHRVSRLPRELDTAFAGGEVLELITKERGAISARGIAFFTIAGVGSFLGFVARDGVWISDGSNNVVPVTDGQDWEGRVDPDFLGSSVLVNDPLNRQLVFLYRKLGQNNNTGVMYLDYQRQQLRVTHPDHGQLSDAVAAPFGGYLRLISADARSANGTLYVEGTTNTNAGAAISVAITTTEMFPANTFDSAALGRAQWMHDATTAVVHHAFTYDRFAHADVHRVDFSSREVTEVGLNREVNSLQLKLSGSFTDAPGIHWLEIEKLEQEQLTGGGA
jgi:hypothetical protein